MGSRPWRAALLDGNPLAFGQDLRERSQVRKHIPLEPQMPDQIRCYPGIVFRFHYPGPTGSDFRAHDLVCGPFSPNGETATHWAIGENLRLARSWPVAHRDPRDMHNQILHILVLGGAARLSIADVARGTRDAGAVPPDRTGFFLSVGSAAVSASAESLRLSSRSSSRERASSVFTAWRRSRSPGHCRLRTHCVSVGSSRDTGHVCGSIRPPTTH